MLFLMYIGGNRGYENGDQFINQASIWHRSGVCLTSFSFLKNVSDYNILQIMVIRSRLNCFFNLHQDFLVPTRSATKLCIIGSAKLAGGMDIS
jgi:hypothetical protein